MLFATIRASLGSLPSALVCCAGLAVAGGLSAAPPEGGDSYTESWESLKRHQAAPEWFRDAKFGIYFHWGVCSVPAFGSEWYPRNISPRADGAIPEEQRQVLLGMGTWLRRYGEAIFRTRPFVTFGEGPTRLAKGGHFVRMKGGYKPEDIRYTRRGDTVYAIALGWPGAGRRLVLETFGSDGSARDVEVDGVSMLGEAVVGHDLRVAWSRTPEGLAVTVPAEGTGELAKELAVVFKLRTSGLP